MEEFGCDNAELRMLPSYLVLVWCVDWYLPGLGWSLETKQGLEIKLLAQETWTLLPCMFPPMVRAVPVRLYTFNGYGQRQRLLHHQ